jgi:hypothetical protein
MSPSLTMSDPSNLIGPKDFDDDEQYMYWPTSNPNRTLEDEEKRPLVLFDVDEFGRPYRRDNLTSSRLMQYLALRRSRISQPALSRENISKDDQGTREPSPIQIRLGLESKVVRQPLHLENKTARGAVALVKEEISGPLFEPATKTVDTPATPKSRLSRFQNNLCPDIKEGKNTNGR